MKHRKEVQEALKAIEHDAASVCDDCYLTYCALGQSTDSLRYVLKMAYATGVSHGLNHAMTIHDSTPGAPSAASAERGAAPEEQRARPVETEGENVSGTTNVDSLCRSCKAPVLSGGIINHKSWCPKVRI